MITFFLLSGFFMVWRVESTCTDGSSPCDLGLLSQSQPETSLQSGSITSGQRAYYEITTTSPCSDIYVDLCGSDFDTFIDIGYKPLGTGPWTRIGRCNDDNGNWNHPEGVADCDAKTNSCSDTDTLNVGSSSLGLKVGDLFASALVGDFRIAVGGVNANEYGNYNLKVKCEVNNCQNSGNPCSLHNQYPAYGSIGSDEAVFYKTPASPCASNQGTAFEVCGSSFDTVLDLFDVDETNFDQDFYPTDNRRGHCDDENTAQPSWMSNSVVDCTAYNSNCAGYTDPNGDSRPGSTHGALFIPAGNQAGPYILRLTGYDSTQYGGYEIEIVCVDTSAAHRIKKESPVESVPKGDNTGITELGFMGIGFAVGVSVCSICVLFAVITGLFCWYKTQKHAGYKTVDTMSDSE